MSSSGLEDSTVLLVHLLLSICMPCLISAFERRSDSRPGYQFSIQKARNFIRVLPLVISAIISIVYVCSIASPALLGISKLEDINGMQHRH